MKRLIGAYLIGALALLSACGSGGTAPVTPPAPPPITITPPSPPPVTPPPASLVGIWQETVSSGGDYTNTITGETFSQSSGFSAKLILNTDGSYSLEHFSKGVSSSCLTVSYLDQSSGTVLVQEDRLILTPTQRTLTINNCTNSGKRTLPNNPIEFAAKVEQYQTLIGETTLKLSLSNGPFPLNLKLLQLDPAIRFEPPAQPADFQLGTDPPYAEFQGLWADANDSDINFYNPETGAFYFPAYNARENRWLRFSGGGYELAKVFGNANIEGVCKKDLIYYEKGTATFKTTDVRNDTYKGDVRFQASQARLIVNIRGSDCGSFAGTTQYDLEPLTAYYKFSYTASVGLALGCVWPRHQWQFAVCVNNVGYNSYGKK